MTTINTESKICTLINVFNVKPEKADELLVALKEATENVISHFEGYVSANLHISSDKRTITNYAQWQSLENYEKMMKDPDAQAQMKKAAALAESSTPIVYDMVWSHERDPETEITFHLNTSDNKKKTV